MGVYRIHGNLHGGPADGETVQLLEIAAQIRVLCVDALREANGTTVVEGLHWETYVLATWMGEYVGLETSVDYWHRPDGARDVFDGGRSECLAEESRR